MTKENILEVIGIYRRYLDQDRFPTELGLEPIKPNRFPYDQKHEWSWDCDEQIIFEGCIGHVRHMLDEMEKFVAEGQMEKVFRWLGFVQGVLWTWGMYSLEELKSHNRPAE